MDKLRRNIGSGIRNLREKKGLTLTQLSELSGIPEADLKNLESEESDFGILALLRVAPILGLEPAAFVASCEKDLDE